VKSDETTAWRAVSPFLFQQRQLTYFLARRQYRNLSDLELKFICVAMPPWPGD
jgi:hypothetical protein